MNQAPFILKPQAVDSHDEPVVKTPRDILPDAIKAMIEAQATHSPLTGGWVLDTHQILEIWFWSSDIGALMLKSLRQQAVPLYASLSSLVELYDVLGRSHFCDQDEEKRQAIMHQWMRIATLVLDPEPISPVKCQDRDDQKWLELACAYKAQGIISEDKLVLKAARRLKNQGIIGLTRKDWLKIHGLVERAF